jgi:hypothetical protein
MRGEESKMEHATCLLTRRKKKNKKHPSFFYKKEVKNSKTKEKKDPSKCEWTNCANPWGDSASSRTGSNRLSPALVVFDSTNYVV